uniref:Uncharacterized protein n=1 Tax=Aegilops tauschii subsp. strangulata TaxID=200361 RepID=A0A453H717_AEGTS
TVPTSTLPSPSLRSVCAVSPPPPVRDGSPLPAGGATMVFKGRFFSSRHKSSESSSPDGSNSPRTPTSAPGAASAASPASSSASSRSDKKKPKSETPKKRDKLFGSAAVAVPSPRASPASSTSSPSAAKHHLRDAAPAAALSPILASSLGLNKIKTRSGPLPHEGQRMAAALGSSNLARGHSQAGTTSGKKAVSSWADSTSAGSASNRGKGKAAEQPVQPVRGAVGTAVEAEGKSAAKGSGDPACVHIPCLQVLFIALLHSPVSWLLIGGS